MFTIYRLNADALDANFLAGLKAAFPHKEIEIAVVEAAADAEAGRNVVGPDQKSFWTVAAPGKLNFPLNGSKPQTVFCIQQTMFPSLKKFLLPAALCVLSLATAHAQIDISVTVAPPVLPVYEQPPCPAEGYLWTPGYWAYTENDYYWVPGVWVAPPRVGVLWTPGYWGFADGAYAFHTGYWGPTVGFYGGVNYGFGYGGIGYGGGGWEGDQFRYNTAVTRVDTTIIHNTYVDRTVINNRLTSERTSFNGGPQGIKAEPTEEQRRAMNAEHINPTAAQEQHRQEASQNKAQFASANHGKPATLAARQVAGGPKPEARAGGQQPPNTRGGTAEERPNTRGGTAEERPNTRGGTPEERPNTRGGTAEERPNTRGGLSEERQNTRGGAAEERPNTHVGTPKQEAPPRPETPRKEPEAREAQPKRPEQAPREPAKAERAEPKQAPREPAKAERAEPRKEGSKKEEPKKGE